MRAVLAILIVGVMPAWAAAQSASAVLPSNDAVISLGWSGSDHDFHDQERWHGSLLVGLTGGHYWTNHLKTEVDASWHRPGRSERYETIQRQGGFTYALSDYRAHDIRVGVAQLYQFGRNEWVHHTSASALTQFAATRRSIALNSRGLCTSKTGRLLS